MAKPRVPLFSMDARGSLADAVTYTRTGRRRVAKRIPSHLDAKSALQLAQRRLYGLAIEWWRYLTPAEKEAHRSAASAAGLPIYQYFIKTVMSTVVDHHTRHELGGADQVGVAGLSGVLADQQVPLIHGDDKHTNVTRELWIPASEGRIIAGTLMQFGVYAVIRGAVNSDEPKVYFTTRVPTDFVAFQSIKAIWTAGAPIRNMYWNLRADYAAEGEPYNLHSEDPALGTTTSPGGNIFAYHEAADPLTLANLATGDLIGILFQRFGSNVLDTLETSMYLYGLLFSYTADH